jgi:hypothetical protein
MSDQNSDDDRDSGEQRDKLLLRLLKTPPQPRPKRVRDKAKIAKPPAKHAKINRGSR